MKGFSQQSKPSINAATAVAVFILLCVFAAGGCEPARPPLSEQASQYLTTWFDAAEQGQRDDALCHGLGLLKHSQFTCEQYLTHAAAIDPTSREIETITSVDCFAKVCGEFFQVYLNGSDKSGNPVEETAVLKRDKGKFRLYWYRSTSLLQQLQAANPDPNIEEKDPQQVMYDELKARYPSLYAYPPCYQIRPSSSNMVGALLTMTEIKTAEVEALAAGCGESFCFASVGQKVATLCPKS